MRPEPPGTLWIFLNLAACRLPAKYRRVCLWHDPLRSKSAMLLDNPDFIGIEGIMKAGNGKHYEQAYNAQAAVEMALFFPE